MQLQFREIVAVNVALSGLRARVEVLLRALSICAHLSYF